MIDKQILNIIEARDNAHILHWQTSSYEEHKALGDFYETITDLLDKFVETYFGRFGRLNLIGLAQLQAIGSNEIVSNTMESVKNIETQISDSDLLNILADMKQLCNHTIYKLSLT